LASHVGVQVLSFSGEAGKGAIKNPGESTFGATAGEGNAEQSGDLATA